MVSFPNLFGRKSGRSKKLQTETAAAPIAPSGIADAQVRDAPIVLPSDDLLGMDFHAQRLVDYVMRIQPPFTIGIYGEWGAGKTSLVQLLHYHAEAREPGKTQFVYFSEWRYKAADELWRALIISIAQKLYDRQPGAAAALNAVAPPPPPGESWRAYLRGAAWGSEDDKPADPYDELVERLDATLYGGIARGRNAQAQLNDQEMMVAALKTATTALESVSPFFATIRKLFGLDGQVDFTSLLHKQKNEATRDRIASIEQFRDEIKKMFDDKAKGKKVCVFIDDLDRVMPDVALDLMEAIRSLLDGVQCTFIVAADQQLIAQGLKARFRDGDQSSGAQVAEFYDRKGREYFEKIVQLGIPVPEPTMDDAHRYVAAQFPAWAAASDLLVTACGANPRRLKQYCVLADYKLAVWRRQQEHQHTALAPASDEEARKKETEDAELRSHLIELYARRPQERDRIVRMSEDANWSSRMARVEGAVEEFDKAFAARAPGDSTMPKDGPLAKALAIHDPDGALLYTSVHQSTPCRILFLTPPRLSESDETSVGAFARFADIKPGADGNLMSGDRVFVRIFEKEIKRPVLVDELLREDFARMAALPDDMFVQLAALAEDPRWADQIEMVEKYLEGTPPAEPHDPLLEPAKQLLELARPAAPADDEIADAAALAANPANPANSSGAGTRPTSVLLQGSVRFSAMLREEVLAFAMVKSNLPAAETIVKTNVGLTDNERQRTHARRAIEVLGKLHQKELEDVKLWLEMRIKAAQRYIELRSFLKLEALRLSWPGLTGHLAERGPMLALESYAHQGNVNEASLGRLAAYRHDARLMRFLQLRPWLKDMPPGQLKAYLATTSPITETIGTAPAAAPGPPPASIAPAIVTPEIVRPAEASFAISRADDEIKVELEIGGLRYANDEKIPTLELEDIMRAAPNMTHESQLASVIGKALFDLAFPEKLRKPLLDALRQHDRIRLWIKPSLKAEVRELLIAKTVETTDAALFNLPWEAMYVSELNGFLAAQGCSIVRSYTARRPTPPLVFDRPLRMLAVFSSPIATAPLDIEAEIATLHRVCGAAEEAKQIQLTVLSGQQATRQNLREAIRAIQPQVFHFTGHGIYDSEKKEGALVFGHLREQQTLDLMTASQVGALLCNNGVLLALLNSCDTGSSGSNAAVTGVAGTLVGQGIPAVIATLRQVLDQTAIMFTKSFYSSLVEGASVEAAMSHTRTALQIERQDWSVYALYSSTRDLDQLAANVPGGIAAARRPKTVPSDS